MGPESHKDLTDEQLKKRRRLSLIIMTILIVVISLDAAIFIYSYVQGKGTMTVLLAGAAACFVVLLPVYLGKKKIDEEMAKRQFER